MKVTLLIHGNLSFWYVAETMELSDSEIVLRAIEPGIVFSLRSKERT